MTLVSIFTTLFRKIVSYIYNTLEKVERFLERKIYSGLTGNQTEILTGDVNLKNRLIEKGIIKEVETILYGVYHDEPRLHFFNIELDLTSRYSDAKKHRGYFASGSSLFNRRQAYLRTVGEATERFCSQCYRNKDLITGRYDDFKGHAIDPRSVAALSPQWREKKDFKITNDSVFRWATGKSLKTGKPYLIPAQLIYLSYDRLPEEPLIMSVISTGAAAWYSLEGAIYRGLCEVVERDAFMICYFNKISPPRLDLEEITDPVIKKILYLLKRYQFDFYFLDITTDIRVPVVLAVIIDRSGVGPPLVVSSCADLNIRKAIEGAIVETLKLRISNRRRFEFSEPGITIEPKDINTFEKRILFWRNPDLVKELAFLFQGPVKKLRNEDIEENNGDDGENLKKVLYYLNKLDIDSFAIDITIPEVKENGLFVVKTVIPSCQPLYLKEPIPCLGGERLYQVPVRMGWRKKPLKEEDLNSLPHPFL